MSGEMPKGSPRIQQLSVKSFLVIGALAVLAGIGASTPFLQRPTSLSSSVGPGTFQVVVAAADGMVMLALLAVASAAGVLWPAGAAMVSANKPSPHYGPVPKNCPPRAPMQRLAGAFHHAFGRAPLWVNPSTVDGILHTRTRPRAPYQKAVSAAGPALTDVITVRGWNLASGKAVMFGDSPQTAGPVLRLDPMSDAYRRDKNARRFLFYCGYLFFPSSGSYVLVGRWKHRAELYPFLVGR